MQRDGDFPPLVGYDPTMHDEQESQPSSGGIMEIEPGDEKYLLSSMKIGEAVLILGAGASASSLNRASEPVKVGLALAELIATRAGLPYNGEKLTEVLSASAKTLSKKQIIDILAREYIGIQPSSELERLFSFTWKRVYTWNIDDALLNVKRRSAQNRRFYNGLIDKAAEIESIQQLHVVALHGDITKPEHGLILTENEYANWIKSDRHFWYQRAAQDYLAFCPIFIGSTLEEPILASELERAGRESNSNLGRAFLITPDSLSPIKKGALDAKGISHIRGTLKDFYRWLTVRMPSGRATKDVVAASSNFTNEILDNLTRDDLAAAQFLRQISPSRLRNLTASLAGTTKSLLARQFLRGSPPSWKIAASDIPVRLEGCSALLSALAHAIELGEKLFVIAGQSGSGKSTAAMMTLIKYVDDNPDVDLFELSSDVRSPKRVFSLLRKICSRKTIIYIGDLIIYGDAFREEIEELSGQNVILVATARSGEWKDRLARYLPEITPFTFQRFVKNDYDPLIERLIKYVPSPRFRQLSRPKQHQALANSNSQLLIALREATESQIFSDIITNEFEQLPDEDTRHLMLIVGLSTMARVGISREAANESYRLLGASRSYGAALDALDGIVSLAQNERLYARHELYVRHIIENVATFEDFSAVIKAILRTYLKYNIPIVRSVNRLDSQLFRFLLNHDFIYQHANRHGDRRLGRDIYSDFEVEFQLDGHFWLQYGLYLAEIDELTDAVDMLKRSIQAYPNNPYVINALADVQLQIAKNRPAYDTTTKAIIDEAVKALKIQDASRVQSDVYPIVTLANGHLAALIRHGQMKLAKTAAAEYFDRLQQLDKVISSPYVQSTKDRILRFVTLNEWK
uniref:Novel STAND NTPase 5 domain-containing protein n=1 Tax=Rhodopseudomonas palustris (strain DX-1) TaxID=652103 RepID=E6VBZ2_RHOPX